MARKPKGMLIASTAVVCIGIFLPQLAQAQTRFSDVSAASGLKIAENTGVGGTNPHAVAVEDFDGDGLAEVIITTFGAPHVYYFQNLGGLEFRDVTKGSGLETFQGEGTGAAVADFDRDGNLDVYLTSLRNGASRLFRNRGNGRFVDVSERAGVLSDQPARSCALSDVDGDGWCDLYATCPSGANRLLRNNKDGTFTDVAKSAGVELADRHSLGCCFGDVDGDGRDDLFVANYQSQECALFKNQGSFKFQEVTREAGLERRASAVGCIFQDIFGRGRLDLYVTTDSWLSGANYTEPELFKMNHAVEPNVLYANEGGGKFTPASDAVFNLKTLAHDAIAEDLDHDGRVEIYVGVDAESGNQWATSKGGNRLYSRSGQVAWREVSKEWGIHHEANCVCVPAADFDNDGDLDLVLVNFYSQPLLLRNNTDDQNWLRVKAIGVKSNFDGIGAQIRVFPSQADRNQRDHKGLLGFRHVQSGAGYCRCSPLEAHFGLGDVQGELRVEVYFPASGKKVATDNVRRGQRLVVREEAAP